MRPYTLSQALYLDDRRLQSESELRSGAQVSSLARAHAVITFERLCRGIVKAPILLNCFRGSGRRLSRDFLKLCKVNWSVVQQTPELKNFSKTQSSQELISAVLLFIWKYSRFKVKSVDGLHAVGSI